MTALADITESVLLLTFDCYGTLIDWERGIRQTLDRLFGPADESREDLIEAYIRTEAAVEQQGYQSYRQVQAQTLRALAASYRLDLPPQDEDALSEALPDWPPFADTNDALRRLKSRYQLGVLSNIDRDLLARTGAHFDVAFDLVVTAEDVHAYKPAHPHFIRLLQQAPDGRPGVLHVAQSLYHDGRPTAELGINYVWINRYHQKRPDDVPMVAEFATLSALAEALGA